jgi:hypothetical protein
MRGTVPPKWQRDGEVECTAPLRDRRVGQAIKARHDLATRRAGRAWVNGRELGGADPRYLEASHD